MGSAAQMALAVGESLSRAGTDTAPASMRIARGACPLISSPSVVSARKLSQGRGSLLSVIFGERGLQRRAVGHGGPAFSLHRQRGRAGAGRGSLPGIAVEPVGRQERGGEDVAAAGGIRFARR